MPRRWLNCVAVSTSRQGTSAPSLTAVMLTYVHGVPKAPILHLGAQAPVLKDLVNAGSHCFPNLQLSKCKPDWCQQHSWMHCILFTLLLHCFAHLPQQSIHYYLYRLALLVCMDALYYFTVLWHYLSYFNLLLSAEVE